MTCSTHTTTACGLLQGDDLVMLIGGDRSGRLVEVGLVTSEDGINEVNEHMPKYVVQRVQELLNRDSLAVNGARVLVLGLAYKAGTSDARETPAIPVIDGLLDLGAAVTAVDAYVDRAKIDPRVARVEFSAAALESSDVVVIVTDHPDFDYDPVARRSRRVLDTRNRLRAWDAPHIVRL